MNAQRRTDSAGTEERPHEAPAVIRRLHPADWAQVRAVRLEMLAEAPYAFASTLEREESFDEAEWRRRLASTAHFGAWDRAAPAAPANPAALIGLAATFPENPDGPTPLAWHLVSMWVSPAHRAAGIGDELVEHVCDLARAHGAALAALWVTDRNPRARAFYGRLGFRAAGERSELRPGEWEERMTRPLGGKRAGPAFPRPG